jgi:hypothetical protein
MTVFTEYRSKFIYVILLVILYFYGTGITLAMCSWVLIATILGRFKHFDRGFLLLIHGMVTFCIHATSYDLLPYNSLWRKYSDELFIIYMFTIFVIDTCPNTDLRKGISFLVWSFGCLLHPAILCEHGDFRHTVWSYGVAVTITALLAGCTLVMSQLKVWDVCTQMSWLYLVSWYDVITFDSSEYQIWIFGLFMFHISTLYVKNIMMRKTMEENKLLEIKTTQ